MRIEDDVVVTDDGVEVLTKVPRTVQEIEETMADKRVVKLPEKACHGNV